MKLIGIALAVLVSTTSAYAAPNFCAGQVKAPAIKLFALHYGIDEVTAAQYITDEVTQRPSLKSLDGKRSYVVLETVAEIGKMGNYRIRMIYAVLGNADPKQDCVLMGQEIYDMSSL